MNLRRDLVRSLFVAAVVIGGALPQSVFAQLGGGVEVDGEGVLRTKFVNDPTGMLLKRRLAEAKAGLNADLARPSKLRKISLNRLEAALAERIAKNAGPTSEMKYLAGLTGIRYVFFYPETGDIVIAGPAEGFFNDLSGRAVGMTSGQSVMELQDMIVALRAFGPGVEPTKSISVSIDPTKEGLAKMQEFLVRIGGRATPSDTLGIVSGLKENLGLQTVSIRGVSPKTHFAQVLTEADYRMKLIGIGLEKPPVKITSYAERASPAGVARNALQRWYFVPNYECVRVSEDALAMELVGDGVKLVGANELVTAQGGRVQAGQGDAASQQFVESFTRNYDKLAEKSPVYAQLRNLIDMVIASAFIQQQDYYGTAGWKMDLFSDEKAYPVETYTAPTQVETAVNAIWKGNRLMTPIGGGVNIQPRVALKDENMQRDSSGEITASREQIDLKTIPAGQWWWD
jgi:hypothetical protein